MSVASAGSLPVAPGLPDRPPGERYYRHPGDVVRLVVWGVTVLVLLLLVRLAPDTTDGLRTDLASAATRLPLALRQLLLTAVQAAALVVPVAVAGALAIRRRWRRLATVAVAAAAGAAMGVLLGTSVADSQDIAGALGDDGWLLPTDFPSPAYLAAVVAASAVAKPWLSRRWRRAADVAAVALGVTLGGVGTTGVPELLLAAAGGGVVGAVVLVLLGAPNRRPTPAAIATALAAAGRPVDSLEMRRAVGGRAQLYRAGTPAGALFLKVYGQDTRDADLLYRGYRAAVLRHSDPVSAPSLVEGVEHEALLLLLAERAHVACPAMRDVVGLADGSVLLAMSAVDGCRLDELAASDADAPLLEALWRQVAALHAAGLAHGALRAGNVLVTADGQPMIIDLGAGATAAEPRRQALDRAELLASLAGVVGPDAAVASAAAALPADDLAAALPFLQPLALSAATRHQTSKEALVALRGGVAEVTGHEPLPLERLVRVRPRTVVTVAALTGAFYVLLPQLADVDESFAALRSANWAWLAASVAMSVGTYVAAAVGLIGGVPGHLPFAPTVEVSLASSFVNRVTPANVGGMALNVRFMQKAGIAPAEAVTGVGLNVLAGGVVHIALLVVFFAWAGRSDAAGFSIPASSTLLVVIAVVLAVVGLALLTRRGRRLATTHVLPPLRQSMASMATLARSPGKLGALFGGSLGVTLAYIASLACAVAAFDGGVGFAQVGAAYLGASLIAAAAPTPGGLGALEAALVAALTGVGMEPAIAVAAVLSYRLLTFWLPIVPGWWSFKSLERRNYV